MRDVRVRLQDERGRIGVGMIIVFSILIASISAAIQVIKIYNAHWAFEEDVTELVRFALVELHDDIQPQIRDRIIEMLDAIGAQYDREQVKVNVDENEKKIAIDVWYFQSVNVPFLPDPKQFHIYIQSVD